MHSYEVINVPMIHPLRYQCEAIASHRHSQQWEQVWVAKASPHHDFLAEYLRSHIEHRHSYCIQW